nr:hypothetical protein [Chenggangzhangella methanolivorans]
MNLVAHMLGVPGIDGQKPAIVTGEGVQVGFSELLGWSSRLASAWKRAGVERATASSSPWGSGQGSMRALRRWRLGAVAVLPEPAMGLAGLRHAARAATPKAYLTDGWFRALGYALPELWRVPLTLTPGDGYTTSGDLLEEVEPDHPGADLLHQRLHGTTEVDHAHAWLSSQPERRAEGPAGARARERDRSRGLPGVRPREPRAGRHLAAPKLEPEKPHEADAAKSATTSPPIASPARWSRRRSARGWRRADATPASRRSSPAAARCFRT